MISENFFYGARAMANGHTPRVFGLTRLARVTTRANGSLRPYGRAYVLHTYGAPAVYLRPIPGLHPGLAI